MTGVIIALAACTMLVLALFMAYILGWANKAFHVEVDPRQEAILEALPGANCGGCGYVGCGEYAEAVAKGEAAPNLCPVGGDDCTATLAEIMGLQVEESHPDRAIVKCMADDDARLGETEYRGERTCTAAKFVAGVQSCTYGCIGFGDCVTACSFDAIHIINGLATVDYEKCVGCGACIQSCPRNIIEMVSFKTDDMMIVGCSNEDFGKDVKAVCKVGCTGCKLCVKVGEGIFKVEDNISIIDYEAYDPQAMDGLNAGAQKCPSKCIVMRGTSAE